MAFVTSEPEALASAAGNLAGIGETMSSGISTTEGPTTGVMAPAADLVSAITAAQFCAHGELYQTMCQQASAIHQQIVNTLGTNAGGYTAAEAANAVGVG
jgi:hypothetical protein